MTSFYSSGPICPPPLHYPDQSGLFLLILRIHLIRVESNMDLVAEVAVKVCKTLHLAEPDICQQAVQLF
ncbi:unnamed protein product [Ranitomeya imitator]|uniref:Uncharacterized protein n=1 Tax=Ranitomeya imitator TaxID=111125 RepID=A0ABN9LV61_9NEOB|nr:unnamed protein product [Ranitomeya imitator]